MTRRDFGMLHIFTTQTALRETPCPIASGSHSTPVSQRLIGRTHPNYLDLMIALAGGTVSVHAVIAHALLIDDGLFVEARSRKVLVQSIKAVS